MTISAGFRKYHRAQAHLAERTCIACGRKTDKACLYRLAVIDGCVVGDSKQVLPGRGAYTCPTDTCLTWARTDRRGCLERAFRRRMDLIDIEWPCLATPCDKVLEHQAAAAIPGRGQKKKTG